MSDGITLDEYGTVINSDQTFNYLAERLARGEAWLFAWTDQEGTQLDILMKLNPFKLGPVQGGLQADDLYVAVAHFGMFGFGLNGREKFPDYIGEKLGLGGANTTTEKLAELINGVCRGLEA